MRDTTWLRNPCVALVLVLFADGRLWADDTIRADVGVYGATPAGILTAVAAHQKEKSVVLVEPGRWVGGHVAKQKQSRQN